MLGEDQVDLWVARLDVDPSAFVLSEDERERAARFHFERDRRRFTVARGVLRRLLAGYLGTSPGALSFVYGERGKPALPGREVEFNLSHSGEIAVYGVTRQATVGIDVELRRPMPDGRRIAERFFSVAEQMALEEPVETGFFRCWTRKEAYIKALGDGLFTSLDRFSVSLGEEARLLQDAADPQASERWRMHSFIPADGYVAAVVVAMAAPSYRVAMVPPP